MKTLTDKLNPGRFPGMSGTMAAIIGCILGKAFTDPELQQLIISDHAVLGRQVGDIGYNDFIGAESDLRTNLENLITAADLSEAEATDFRRLAAIKIQGFHFTPTKTVEHPFQEV